MIVFLLLECNNKDRNHAHATTLLDTLASPTLSLATNFTIYRKTALLINQKSRFFVANFEISALLFAITALYLYENQKKEVSHDPKNGLSIVCFPPGGGLKKAKRRSP
jgi:hypothetical protein